MARHEPCRRRSVTDERASRSRKARRAPHVFLCASSRFLNFDRGAPLAAPLKTARAFVTTSLPRSHESPLGLFSQVISLRQANLWLLVK